MFNYIYQIYSKIPIVVTFASGIIDQIIQVVSDEINFLFILSLYIIVIYKHYIFLQNEELAKEFDLALIDSVSKINEISEKYKKFRFEIKSKLSLYSLPTNVSDYIRFLNQNLKSGMTQLKHFQVRNFLSFTKEINGLRLHPNYGKINEDINRSLIGENNLRMEFAQFTGLREQINRHFDMAQFEKFNFFRYNENSKPIEGEESQDVSPKKYNCF
jgi:hypothetical protein